MLLCIQHVYQRLQLQILRQDNVVDVGYGATRREHNHFLIFVECLDPGFTLDDLVEGRVLELIQ